MKLEKLLLLLPVAAAVSCNYLDFDSSPGTLGLSFSDHAYIITKQECELPDTNDFILRILDSKGGDVFKGKYCDSRESFSLKPGTYTVSVASAEFSVPKFSMPQYGDVQQVTVRSGQPSHVELLCRQQNAGMRLNIAQDFLKAYPNATLHLKSKEGSLLYSYKETRIAYFKPGQVSLVLSESGKDKTLFSRTLESCQILTLNISASSPMQSEGVSISIDTARVWTEDRLDLGSGSGSSNGKGGSISTAMDVSMARTSAGAEDVWVHGFIVGADLTSSGASFSGPFKSRTNIILGSRTTSSDRNTCLSVQLQKGNIRDALNLVDNPDMLGVEVFLKGDIVESYYGMPGLQKITEFKTD